MAIIRQNLEFMSPEEGDADSARQNKITFTGFKSGDVDFNDVTSGVGPITHYASGGGAGAAADHGGADRQPAGGARGASWGRERPQPGAAVGRGLAAV